MTALEEIRQMVEAEAERLEAQYGEQIISLACTSCGYDKHVALSTYRRDGVPWYVTPEKARLLGLSIEEQLRSAA